MEVKFFGRREGYTLLTTKGVYEILEDLKI